METKDRILPDEELVDVAETLYNFRGAMDIEGIKNTLWQLAKRQDNISFKAGRNEIIEKVKGNTLFSAEGLKSYLEQWEE